MTGEADLQKTTDSMIAYKAQLQVMSGVPYRARNLAAGKELPNIIRVLQVAVDVIRTLYDLVRRQEGKIADLQAQIAEKDREIEAIKRAEETRAA